MRCSYCDFVYVDQKEYYAHLNAKHFKCSDCSRTFNVDQEDQVNRIYYAVCSECEKKDNEIDN